MRNRSRRHPRRSTRFLLAGMAAALVLALLTGTGDVHPVDTVPAAPAHKPAETVLAPASSTPQNSPPKGVLGTSRPTRLIIPAIGVDTAGIVDLRLRADRTMEVPAEAGTVGWYTDSPTPGESGPALLAAHVDWQGRQGVFHNLRELHPGNQVTVERADGSAASFTIQRVEQHPKDRFPTQAVYGHVEGPELRLVTCGGHFDRKAGSYRDNIVVYARMTGSRHRDGSSR